MFVAQNLCGMKTGEKEYEKIITTISMEEEESNGGAAPNSLQYHICPDCFKDHLSRWFESHRAKPETTSVW
jgi:hypothetical protein